MIKQTLHAVADLLEDTVVSPSLSSSELGMWRTTRGVAEQPIGKCERGRLDLVGMEDGMG